MRSSGTLLCLGSGAAFGAMAVFGKLAYGDGATVGTLLAVRFVLAAALFWALVLAGAAHELRALGGRVSLFFAGLRRVGPATASILATVEPLVTVLLAFLVFGETLVVVQLVGGALVLAAVLVLHAPRLWRRQPGMRATAAGVRSPLGQGDAAIRRVTA